MDTRGIVRQLAIMQGYNRKIEIFWNYNWPGWLGWIESSGVLYAAAYLGTDKRKAFAYFKNIKLGSK